MRGDKTREKILAIEGVAEVWSENSGWDGRATWWIATKRGWRQGDNLCHSWSGPTLGILLRDARDLVRCDCAECKPSEPESMRQP